MHRDKTRAHLVRDGLVVLAEGAALALPARVAAKGADDQQQRLAGNLPAEATRTALTNLQT